MRTASLISLLGPLAFACFTERVAAQCPEQADALTPTIRALLMLERPAALSEEQWAKVFENPDNRMDMSIAIYEEDRFDPCELPPMGWYVMMAGSRPQWKSISSVTVRDRHHPLQ